MRARATSFATLKDLRGYIKCRDNGGSQRFCLNKGDNGEGMWGDNTAQLDVPMVALPVSEMKKKWGNTSSARGKPVRLRLLRLSETASKKYATAAGKLKKAKGMNRIPHIRVMANFANVGHGLWFTAQCRDGGPAGVIDLNPAALESAGLKSDTELSATAEWEWA